MTAITPQNGAALKVVNEREVRTDLASRREVKFAIEGADVHKLRGLLRQRCRRLSHNLSVSKVNSVYFDDASLSACRANLNGLSLRRKFRLRWYDQPLPGKTSFMEIKWRDNRVTGKHRFELQAETPVGDWTYQRLVSAVQGVAPSSVLADVYRYDEPIVLVQYAREHFTNDQDLRLTLDYDLQFYDQSCRRRISRSFAFKKSNFVVLEAKVPVGREAEIRDWIYPLNARATRCSKYVYGCHAVGLIRSSEL